MTRVELLTARRLIKKLAARDFHDHLGGSNPGAYAWIEDQIDRLLTEKPRPAGLRYGQPVRVTCSATGRYLYEGEALWVSAMDNSINLSEVSEKPAEPIVLVDDNTLEIVAEVFRHFLPGAMS